MDRSNIITNVILILCISLTIGIGYRDVSNGTADISLITNLYEELTQNNDDKNSTTTKTEDPKHLKLNDISSEKIEDKEDAFEKIVKELETESAEKPKSLNITQDTKQTEQKESTKNSAYRKTGKGALNASNSVILSHTAIAKLLGSDDHGVFELPDFNKLIKDNNGVALATNYLIVEVDSKSFTKPNGYRLADSIDGTLLTVFKRRNWLQIGIQATNLPELNKKKQLLLDDSTVENVIIDEVYYAK
ncbi:hypothetical protein [Vibrio barjaei]|uniref:hypothetical protein n=1 Tax=Vibrio barjaei TaxID=1676683 RepID=UPI002284173A|nr:hypothetical protein [Vibrio barjaei]MCY9872950.1 hypothetical protein [Vibrio barjaei]